MYLNVTNETYWNKAGTTPFEAKFYFKYYDSGSDLPDMPLTCSTPLEDYVYYAIVPNNDYVGRVQVERYGIESLVKGELGFAKGDEREKYLHVVQNGIEEMRKLLKMQGIIFDRCEKKSKMHWICLMCHLKKY